MQVGGSVNCFLYIETILGFCALFDILSAVFVFTLHIAIKQTPEFWSGINLGQVQKKKSDTLFSVQRST